MRALALLVLAVVLVSGCVVGPTIEIKPTQVGAARAHIDTNKTAFSAGENASGWFVMENALESLGLASCAPAGGAEQCQVVLGGGTRSALGLTACEPVADGTCGNARHFTKPGTYTYRLRVYNCSELENAGIGCSNVEPGQLQTIAPRTTAEKTITVSGPAAIPAPAQPGLPTARIDTPKTAFSVGEELKGLYVADNVRNSIGLAGCTPQGGREQCQRLLGTEARVDVVNLNFAVCEPDSWGTCYVGRFTKPGTYTYRLRVYDCHDLEKAGISCGTVEPVKPGQLESISPVASAEKTITVS